MTMPDEILTPLEWDAACIMEQEGGAFVARLGVLLRYADADNLRRLRAAFPEYLEKYQAEAKCRKPFFS